MAQPRPQQKKATFHLQPPYSNPTWPEITKSVQQLIIELLCQLLSQHSPRSKPTKRTKTSSSSGDLSPKPSSTSSSFLTIGLNATSACLERTAASTGYAECGYPRAPIGLHTKSQTRETTPKHITTVFVCLSDIQSPFVYAHLPLLCYVASTGNRVVKLVSLPKGSDEKLAKTLGLPSVGVLGVTSEILDGTTLYQVVSENIPAVRVPWIQDQKSYQATATQAFSGKVKDL